MVFLPPDAPTVESYREDELDELKAKASAQLELLMNQAAILRDPLFPCASLLAGVHLTHLRQGPSEGQGCQ